MYRSPLYAITAYPPTIRYRTSAKARNRSLKSELIGVSPLRQHSGFDEFPGGLEDRLVPGALPELDIEIPVRFIAPDEA